MKYLIEIDGDKPKGAQLMNYISHLDADDETVHYVEEPPIRDEEMGLPGRKTSEAKLLEWLRPDDNEEEVEMSVAFEQIRQELKKRSAERDTQ